jgi:predicted transposase YdaD
VADLLRGFVPEPWVAEVDFTTLTPVKGSYVSDGLRQRHDDVVWKVRLREQWLYVYVVIEFQAEPDPFMALRLLVYVGLLYQDLPRGCCSANYASALTSCRPG